MNKNEIRGYIFMGFALLCLCTSAMGGMFMLYMNSSTRYHAYAINLMPILSAVFFAAAVICFVKAYDETRGQKNIMEQASVLYRIGQSWTQFNLFSMKPANVKVKTSEDGAHLLCDVQILAENWMTQLKSGGNVLSFHIRAEGDFGKNKVELQSLGASSFSVAAGEHTEFEYPLAVPEYIDRVVLHFTAESDSMDEVYQQDYEFYPGHYTR